MEVITDIIITKNLIRRKLRKITKRICFEEISKEWIDSKKNFIKTSTYCNYIYTIHKYLYPYFGGMKIRRLRKYNYNNIVDEMMEGLEAKTVRDIINILKQILRFAQEEYNCNIKYEKIQLPKIENNRIKVFNKNERTKIENYCIKIGTLKSYGILICLNSGLRIGELCALKWRDIDLEERMIDVHDTLQRIYLKEEGKTKIIIDAAKTACSIRSIPISDKLYNILKELSKKSKKDEFFLTSSNKKYVEPRSYQNIYKEILKKSKVKYKKFHTLRHTFATDCIEAGMDAKALSEILGHANVNITLNRYVHSSNKMKRKYMNKL